MFKGNNKDARTMSITTSGIFIVNFEHILYLFLVFLLLTLMLAGNVPSCPQSISAHVLQYQILRCHG